MHRRSFLPAALGATAAACLAGTPVGWAYTIASPTSLFSISAAGTKRRSRWYLVVREGKLSFQESNENFHGDTKPSPGRWEIYGTQIVSTTNSWYLAYDPSGEHPEVYLSAKPVRGAVWDIQQVSTSGGGALKDSGASLDETLRGVTVHAGKGPMRGWTLGIETVEDRCRSQVRRVSLAKDPAVKLEVKRIFKFG